MVVAWMKVKEQNDCNMIESLRKKWLQQDQELKKLNYKIMNLKEKWLQQDQKLET